MVSVTDKLMTFRGKRVLMNAHVIKIQNNSNDRANKGKEFELFTAEHSDPLLP